MSKADEEVFSAALEFDTSLQQEEWIEYACGDDAEQAIRIRRLLRAHQRMKQSNNQEIASPLDRADDIVIELLATDDVSPGTLVGGYEIIEKIGEGGVGVVFRALQKEPIEREVALKLIKPGMDSQRILSRFAIERQVLGQLDHAGITRIYEAGVQANGRPYFAMQLVANALSLVEYCDTYAIDLRTRIQLFVSVCKAVQHAHQRGIIHRDLKPSNILIEGNSEPSDLSLKIIDFGIAKVTRDSDQDATAFTSQGERFGTPAYMSPEQALNQAGGVDIRSDVYSLGAVLYELLAGVTPHALKEDATSSWTKASFWIEDVLPPSKAYKRHLEPGRDSIAKANPKKIPVDLDWVCIKALATKPEDRYQTTADLQRDLERFLAGEPVEAAGPSLPYRVSKFVRRNKLFTLGTSTLVLTIVTTSIVTTSYAIRANRAEAEAKIRLHEVEAMQAELTRERDTSEAARRKAVSILRVFQVQSATSKALGAYYEKMFSESFDPLITQPDDLLELAQELDANNLVQPHHRLIICGNWNWAAEPFPDDAFVGTLHLSSRQIVQAMEEEQNGGDITPDQQLMTLPDERPDETNEGGLSLQSDSGHMTKFDFQDLLLEELYKIVGESDPFVAEILDTRGLLAMDRGELEIAETCLRKALRIWQGTGAFDANAAQSALFLAETRSARGDWVGARAALATARSILSDLPAEEFGRKELLAFLAELSLRTSEN